jgi:Uncharacterized conserved protein
MLLPEMKVEIVPYDRKWREAFEAESKLVAASLGGNTFSIHHIGSTSIPNIYAKPVIDILVEVIDIQDVDLYTTEMSTLGYEVMGEFGIPDRRYFRKDNEIGIRTHQIHAFQKGCVQITRHLAFRDYMIAHPEEAEKYSELKRKLVELYAGDPESYIDGKDAFIQEIDRRAAQWILLI